MVTKFKTKAPVSFKARFVKAVATGNLSALATLANDIAKDYFAPYACRDNHGTNILCWTMQGATEWLPYMANDAVIVETMDYQILVARVQQ